MANRYISIFQIPVCISYRGYGDGLTKLVLALTALFISLNSHGLPRSQPARHAFVKTNACPANGAHRLPCKGYVIDHIKPLACGGADSPGNMQWQTIAEGKAKDKWERKGCGK